MSRKISYEDCLNFIENYLHIELLDFQKEILKHICNGEYISGGRGCGRHTVIKGYNKYVSNLLDKNYCEVRPNITNYLPKSNNLLSSKIEEAKLAMSSPSVKDGYFTQFYCIDEEPFIEFKNGSWIKIKE